jgi:hypothetical protein
MKLGAFRLRVKTARTMWLTLFSDAGLLANFSVLLKKMTVE